MSFPFEQLDVYQKSLVWVETVESLCISLKKKVSYTLLDQLCRASLSIPLNIAEGNGRWHQNEKKQFFRIARGSTFECVPIIQVLMRKGFTSQAEFAFLYEQLENVAKMLTKLIKSVDNLKR